MTIIQSVVKGFVALSSALFLSYPVTSAMADPLADVPPVGTLETVSNDSGSLENCQNIKQGTIILSSSTAIFARPQETVRVSPDTAAHPLLLQLVAPLALTDTCILGQSAAYPTLLEAQLEAVQDLENMEGVVIKTRSIVVSGHYLPFTAESNIIPFERHVGSPNSQRGTNPLCGVLGILPNVFIDSHEMGAGISSQDLTVMTGGVCEMLFSQPSYTLQAEINSETFYNLRFSGIQSIPVPSALRGVIASK